MVDPVRAVARLSERFQPRESGEGQESSSFAKMLADAFDAANQAQWDADQAARLLATGPDRGYPPSDDFDRKGKSVASAPDLHSKQIIEAYQEISRMQI